MGNYPWLISNCQAPNFWSRVLGSCCLVTYPLPSVVTRTRPPQPASSGRCERSIKRLRSQTPKHLVAASDRNIGGCTWPRLFHWDITTEPCLAIADGWLSGWQRGIRWITMPWNGKAFDFRWDWLKRFLLETHRQQIVYLERFPWKTHEREIVYLSVSLWKRTNNRLFTE